MADALSQNPVEQPSVNVVTRSQKHLAGKEIDKIDSIKNPIKPVDKVRDQMLKSSR